MSLKSLCLLAFCATMLSGCSYFGYYKYEKAVWAPAEVGEKVHFPDSYEGSLRMEGRMTRALAVAMNDFLPAGTRLRGDNQRVALCLSRWDTYDIAILPVSEDLYFIQFSPMLARCGIDDSIIVDAGAEYAVDGNGRILGMH
jgi:hypothetical protein